MFGNGRLLKGLIGLSSLIIALNVGAQENTDASNVEGTESVQTPQKSSSNAKKGAEKITVTGSHIKRIQVEGPAPVEILDKEYLEKTGHNSVSDVLRDLTGASFGSDRENSGSSTAAVATVSLRGLGASRTLVLMNGRRLPKDSIDAAVDLNNLPMAAVERIEILKDGASALYGSDAVGGVVNIITIKDFEGFAVNLSATANTQDLGEDRPEAGSRLTGALTYGLNTEKFNLVTVLNVRQNENLFSRERDYTSAGVSKIGDIPATSTGGDPPFNSPGCPADRLDSQGRCEFNYTLFSDEIPTLEQYSLLSEASYAVTPISEIFLRASLTHKKSRFIFAPPPGIFDVSGQQILYRVMELGNRITDFETNAGYFGLGYRTEILSDWELTVDTSYNLVDRSQTNPSGYATKTGFEGLISSGGFNPGAPAGSRIVDPAAFAAAKTQPFSDSKSTLLSVNTLMTGELADSISMAVGASFMRDRFQVEVDDETAANNVFSSGAANNSGGHREVKSAFVELGYLFTDNLELQAAARYDDFSDFGTTMNPKFALRYQPNKKTMLRGSIGTGFKAPDLQSLYGNGSFGFPTFIDKKLCNDVGGNDPNSDACQPAQYFVESPSNTDLEEERFWSANIGALYQITKNHSIGIDIFYLSMDNVVGIDYEALTEAELNGTDLSAQGITVSRNPTTGEIDPNLGGIFAPALNLSRLKQLGVDVVLDNKIRFSPSSGLLDIKTSFSYLFAFESEGFPGLGFEDTLGESGRPEWRASLNISYIPVNFPLITSVLTRVIGPYECAVKELCEIDTYAEADLQLVYKSGIGSFTLGIQNLLGTEPPLDTSDPNNQLNGSLYSTRGQNIFLGYGAKF